MNKPTIPYWPRAMRLVTAAAYVDLSTAEFLKEVKNGVLPDGFRLGRSEHWDRRQIDTSLDRLTGATDDWRHKLGLLPAVPDTPRFEPKATPRQQATDPEPERRTKAFKITTLAAHWKCSDTVVRSLIEKGDLKAFRVGRLIRITPEAVEDYEIARLRGSE